MTVIDSLEFARTGQQLAGRLPIPEMGRLRESLADLGGDVEFVVTGGRDSRRRLALNVRISGVLHLQCQRCLEPLTYPLRLSNTLLLVEGGGAGDGEVDAEEAEWIEASAALDLAALVEDEILLSLPYAPRHEAGACLGKGTGGPETVAGASPFAKLAGLKRIKD